MLSSRFTAVFPDNESAERAIKDLRARGVKDSAIAVVSQSQQVASTAAGAAQGLAVGAGVGALCGLAAMAIPGIGPIISAGFLVASLGAAGGAAATGALVGGGVGLLAGALSHAGYPTDEAEFLSSEIEAGRTLVVVESGAPITEEAVEAVFAQYNARRFT